MSELLEGLDNLLMKARLEGIEAERNHIIKLWDQEMKCECEDPMRHLLTLIKGEK